MDEQTQQKSDSSGSEDALRELAVRLLTFHHGLLQAPQLLVGQLPPDLPVELPLPEGSRLLGSLAVENPIIVIETQLAREDVMAFYRERLTTAGWIVPEHFGPHQGGFIHSSMADRALATFFAPDDRYTLTVLTKAAPGGRTSVQLTLQGDTAEFRPRRMRHGPDFVDVLPPIRPPRRAMQMPRGGSSGPDSAESAAALETDLDLAAVSIHYVDELERDGWRRLDAGTSGPAAWSAWSFVDTEGATWEALLLILQRPSRHGKYALTLSAERERDAPQSGSVRGVVRSSMLGSSWSSFEPTIGTQSHSIDEAPRPAPEPPEPKE